MLGDAAEVSHYVSPALAADLSGLPPTYIDAGTAEVFRDEDVAYATRICGRRGEAELHVWAAASMASTRSSRTSGSRNSPGRPATTGSPRNSPDQTTPGQ